MTQLLTFVAFSFQWHKVIREFLKDLGDGQTCIKYNLNRNPYVYYGRMRTLEVIFFIVMTYRMYINHTQESRTRKGLLGGVLPNRHTPLQHDCITLLCTYPLSPIHSCLDPCPNKARHISKQSPSTKPTAFVFLFYLGRYLFVVCVRRNQCSFVTFLFCHNMASLLVSVEPL